MIRLPIFLMLMILGSFAYGEERIAGTLDDVDLIIERLEKDNGHDYGERYFALNRGTSPVRLTIKITDIENADQQLLSHTLILNPHERVDLGTVVQTDITKEARWKYEWSVEPDIRAYHPN